MKKYLILLPILLIVIAIINNKKIVEYILVKNLSKIIDQKVTLKLNKIDYFSGNIEIFNIKIKNQDNFFNDNIFEAKKLKINLDITTIMSDLVVVENLFISEPKFYFEIRSEKKIDKGNELNDNLNLLSKINTKDEPKIYPEKKKDINFLIAILNLKDSITYIKSPKNSHNINVILSDMRFVNVGNSAKKDRKKFQHYKDIMKIILTDAYLRITDEDLKNLIKINYDLK